MSVVDLALCVPIIRTDFIGRYLETLYKYTPDVNFRVFVLDQSVNGMDPALIKKYVHWYVRPYHNLGFAKAANELLHTAYRQGYPYIACCNDDIEYINAKWWSGILSQFDNEGRILAVSPESPRIPLWGYGTTEGEVCDLLEYKPEYSEEDYQFLLAGDFHDLPKRYPNLPKTFPLKMEGVIDGFAMWHPVFKRECLETVGYLDEKFMYGGGEDYDYMARGYRLNKRLVCTMKSWVWHWWGQSKDQIAKLPPELFDRPFWNNNDELWPKEWNFGQSMDPWGHATDPVTGARVPLKRVPEVYIDPI